jgi:hypothetical protein
MTEVVHCKSRSEIGVRPAVTHCASLHLDRILARSPAPRGLGSRYDKLAVVYRGAAVLKAILI